ncbi:HprK-related kinase A [Sphingomonas paeninsulae]|uniref:HprK-related kinase A n=1 Tax=Sphingomonas paeninsulae TaxID=2319844 RepID=A0A494TJY5_SPHPE|nr:HprK-related kinase A [Sphingomonas paeninsulae]AYJ87363.1 HprK-related kinase A [Sphingomonas paeninsulae]
MRHSFDVQVGPIGFRIGSAWSQPIETMEFLYAGYPRAPVPDYTVRLEPPRPWRRLIRPSVSIQGDHVLPEAAPLPLAQALLAAEMGMNLQVALGERRFLLLHAACVERDGRALILTGESGSGKSTMSALLGASGWRFMGDEFVLIEPATGLAHPFPRPVSLKNESIAALTAILPDVRFGPLLRGTPKGDVRHLRPDLAAIANMAATAIPALILFPCFGPPREIREVAASEAFVRLTQASTNYVALGESGFTALTRLVTTLPARAIDYPDTATGIAQIEELWSGL